MDFSHKAIEKKWQKYWAEQQIYQTTNKSDKKAFVLDMFPFPSGAGLHVGHVKGYTASDVFARFRRMQGYDVLHPIGWDAFGLPAEQYALKTGNDPREFTLKNIDTFRRQLKAMAFSFDYDKEVNTSDPNYFKTTQWIFQELYKLGLAENRDIDVNWCQELGTVLANDEVIVVDGKMVSERGEHLVVKRKMRQWVLKITAYAEKLLAGLDGLNWPQAVKDLQKNWIGKSVGAEIIFKTEQGLEIPVFTTRPDTICGVSYVVLAPESDFVQQVTTIDQQQVVDQYVEMAKTKTEIDRKDETREKTGVFTGTYVINPYTQEKVQLWVADYVLNNYGTGAVMSVPAHDVRDWDFATKFNLVKKFVLAAKDHSKPFIGESVIINSGNLDGLTKQQACEKVIETLIASQQGKKQVNYKLHDWIFSRQRFYGEPFPVLYNELGEIELVDLKDLPVTLPTTEYIKPSGTGESPLANVKDWVNVEINGQHFKRDTNTMPQTAGSAWYFLAYILTNQPGELIDIQSDEAKARFAKWLPVDLYIGGQEHAVGHLLYARFWMHVLYDLGIVPVNEPFQNYFAQGMILGPDGRKMSKSWGNVINPDDVIASHGADTLRLYEMFMGPLDASLPWSYDGLDAALKWLNRAYRLVSKQKFSLTNNGNLDFIYNSVVQKVTAMIEEYKFNTAISQLMVLVNAFYKEDLNTIYQPYVEGFIKMLSTFAPHVAEEMNQILENQNSVVLSQWPTFDQSKMTVSQATIAIQVNGKLRATIEVELDMNEQELLTLAKAEPNVMKFLADHKIIKEIIVPNKIINFVVK